ncbi:MAG: CDP-diacylglycerol--serine O-phosphatidyltransferase [Calditrichaeota bacterium]|nr:MAG: CDP-diacylglycerol--serine O-phosphatidyltransferase [Calditrichota bacterium]
MRVAPGIVPGFFTMANMFCGYYATLQAAKGQFITATWLIFAAAVLDALDGKLARLTGTASKFGVQYDSLADVVSFGLAPSALAYFVFFHQWGAVGLFLSFTPLVFGSVRLARFNVRLKGFDKEYFEGLPIPAAALALSTFVMFNFEYWHLLRWSKVFLSLMLLVSILMISSIRYEKMPNFTLKSDRKERIKILLLIIGSLLIIIFPYKALFPLALIYVFSGPGYVVWKLFNQPTENSTPAPKDD